MSTVADDKRVASPLLVILGNPGETSALERAIGSRLGWQVLVANDADAVIDAHAKPVRCYILAGDCRDELVVALRGRPAQTPLLVTGSQPRSALEPVCWLPTMPSPSLLATLLVQLTGAAPVTRNWRRKSDMIIGNSPAIGELLSLLDRVAPADGSVLITGESGTGKELVARALHYSGPRADSPFVAINCAAIPEPLVEAELFGHVRGAFTGAVASRAGVFEAAHGGTLFLDELGDMPLHAQAKLLRVIETRQVTRVGSNESREVDVRLVAATNRQLDDDAAAGRFREDLLYRVRVFQISIPPLRDRPEDVPPLVSHYLAQLSARDRRPEPTITRPALAKLLQHRWPGNVRELVNVLERALILAMPGGIIEETHIVLPEEAAPMIAPFRDARDRFEAEYYSQLLRTAGGNISLVAKLARRTRAQVYEALRRLEIEPARFRRFELEQS